MTVKEEISLRMLESLAWEKLKRETPLGFAKEGDLGHMRGNQHNYPMTSLLDSQNKAKLQGVDC